MTNKKIPDAEYKKILENMPICCVDLVIENKNRALIILRGDEPDKGTWSIPGGRIYKREMLEEAVIRKAYEETGLKTKIKRKIDVYETIFDKSQFNDLNSGVHTINIGFLVNSKEDNVRLDKTSLKYRWISQVENYLNPYARKVLIDSMVFNK